MQNLDVLKQVIILDANVRSVIYNEASQNLTVIFGGGSKFKYHPITVDQFDYVVKEHSARPILDLVHNPSIVGIRLK